MEQVPDLDDNFPTIDVIIKETTEKGIVTLGDLSLCTNNAGNIDKSLEHFLNLATSQYVMFNKWVSGVCFVTLKFKRFSMSLGNNS